MKRLVLLLAAVPLLAVPAGAGASDLMLRRLDISIGVGHPERDRRPEVVYVRDRHDRRGDRHHRQHWKEKHYREEPRVIVIDDRRRHCDSERVVVTRPGNVVVIADGRRW